MLRGKDKYVRLLILLLSYCLEYVYRLDTNVNYVNVKRNNN